MMRLAAVTVALVNGIFRGSLAADWTGDVSPRPFVLPLLPAPRDRVASGRACVGAAPKLPSRGRAAWISSLVCVSGPACRTLYCRGLGHSLLLDRPRLRLRFRVRRVGC